METIHVNSDSVGEKVVQGNHNSKLKKSVVFAVSAIISVIVIGYFVLPGSKVAFNDNVKITQTAPPVKDNDTSPKPSGGVGPLDPPSAASF